MRVRRPVHALAIVAVVAAAGACAQPTPPPGGPPDHDAPRLLGATPDSGTVRVRVRDAVFQFDEIINEQPSGAQSLAQMVFVSPSTGSPEVRWRRSSLAVRPRGGWRENTTYVVTLLPGIADLRGNARDSATVLVFSTADSIPRTRLSGVVFDWGRNDVANRALVQARPADDSTLVYSTESDSTGRFLLPYLTPGDYVVHAIIDGNRNRATDPREPWDSVLVTLRDTASRELYAFIHDTLPPRTTSVAFTDSLAIRVSLDAPLGLGSTLSRVAELFAADSSPVPIARVIPWSEHTDERAARDRARRDSIERADTSTAARAARDRRFRDSVNRAAAVADSIARDTTRREPRPTSRRPRLVTEFAVILATPADAGASYRLRLTLTGMLGGERTSQHVVTRPRPVAPPTRPDTGGVATTQPPRSR